MKPIVMDHEEVFADGLKIASTLTIHLPDTPVEDVEDVTDEQVIEGTKNMFGHLPTVQTLQVYAVMAAYAEEQKAGLEILQIINRHVEEATKEIAELCENGGIPKEELPKDYLKAYV